MIKSAWKMDEYQSPVKKSWATENTKQNIKEGYGRPQMQPHVAGSTNAPYATLHNRDPDRKVNLLSGGKTCEDYVKLFREKLKSRGARGILGLQRLFKIMDDDYSKNISVYEFTKACNDFRVGIPEEQVKAVFN